MKEKKQKFIRILNTELDDLAEDLNQLMSTYKEKLDKGEMTNYVYLENIALLKNQISCLKNFAQFVSRVDVDRFETLEELFAFVEAELTKHQKESCYIPSIESVLKRKLQKVLTYVKS